MISFSPRDELTIRRSDKITNLHFFLWVTKNYARIRLDIYTLSTKYLQIVLFPTRLEKFLKCNCTKYLKSGAISTMFEENWEMWKYQIPKLGLISTMVGENLEIRENQTLENCLIIIIFSDNFDLQPSMFTQITVRLVSSFVEKSGGLGGWGVRHDFLAVWSAGMISSAINTLMALEESGPFLSLVNKFYFTFGCIIVDEVKMRKCWHA